jgi:hypothetical protein
LTVINRFGEMFFMSAALKYSLREKVKVLGWFALGYGIFYIFPNFYASWKPSQLPLTWVDHSVPFLPWTFLIYTSDYLLILLAVLIIEDKESFQSFSRTMFCTLFICGLFFLFFPFRHHIDHQGRLGAGVDQGCAAGRGQTGFFRMVNDFQRQASAALHVVQKRPPIAGLAARLGGDGADKLGMALAQSVRADFQGRDRARHRGLAQHPTARQPFAEANNLAEAVHHPKTIAMRLCDQQTAIIGAEVQGGISVAAPGRRYGRGTCGGIGNRHFPPP